MSPNSALKLAIFQSGMTQERVGQKCRPKILPSRLSKISRGHAEPTDEEKKALARVLNTTVDHLFSSGEAVAS
jgi:transcriptional regulator with XRE-family HTH domain